MEKNIKDKEQYVCSCDNCRGYGYMGGWGGYQRFFFLRWFLGLMILLIVLLLGIKIGEFKGYFDAVGYGGMGMYGRHWQPDPYMYPMMMKTTQVPATTNTTTPSSGTSKTTK